MRRPRLALAAALLAGAGCASGLEVSTTVLNDAEVAHGYEAHLAVADSAAGSLVWTVSEGGLPDGLTLSGDGTISGTPWQIGTFALTVLVVDGEGNEGSADLTLEVGWRDGEVFPWVAQGETIRLCDNMDLLCGPWVRIVDAGISGQDTRAMAAEAVWFGENGIAEDGLGDDVVVGTPSAEEIAWSFVPGTSQAGYGGVISPTDTTVSADGVLTAGEKTGPGEVVMAWGGAESKVPALVIPPDWCPEPNC